MGKAKKVEDIVERVAPHTIKKCELIEAYVDEWARKILGFNGVNGREGSKGIIYIDCMSNCGLYYDTDGELVDGTAIRVAKKLNQILPNYPGKNGLILFNDLSEQKKERLESELSKLQLSNVTIKCYCGDGNRFLRELDIKNMQQSYGTLLLYDPYQATIDWDAITPFLNVWGEVIINHMVSDTNRGAAQATRAKAKEKYQETYQADIESIIKIGNDKKALNDVILDIIRRRSSGASRKRYLASFPFFNRTNGLIYNLIHVSGNIEGLKLFKKVAWKTFGDKSSLKNTHDDENQIMFDLGGNGSFSVESDDDCYYVKDIAWDVVCKFKQKGAVPLKEIWAYLDEHPIFPSDGYKSDIKKELKMYAKIPKTLDGDVTFIR